MAGCNCGRGQVVNASASFPRFVASPKRVDAYAAVLDGELVCLDDEGCPDFDALRSRLGGRGRRGRPVTFMAFDLLHVDGDAVRERPYAERRHLLGRLVREGGVCRVPRSFGPDEFDGLLRATSERQLEGVVFKRADAPYRPGRRSPAWVKVKHRRRGTFAVTGWAPARGGQPERYMLARRDGETLRPAGSVSFGLSAADRDRLRAALAEADGHVRGGVRWVAPVVDVDVDYHGRGDQALRDPIMRALS
jgi:bifunctional non-homologous end joining protein LigD